MLTIFDKESELMLIRCATASV